MTAYRGIRSFRGEQTSDIIRLLVREYVLICISVYPLTLLQRNSVLLWSVLPLKSPYPTTNNRCPRGVQ